MNRRDGMKAASKSHLRTSIKLLGIFILALTWAAADQFVSAKATPDKKPPTPPSERIYSAEGTPLLIMETLESQTQLLSALVHVDGRKGDELVVYVPNYGLVALGVAPIPPPSSNAKQHRGPRGIATEPH
jgi:hypothetical protein